MEQGRKVFECGRKRSRRCGWRVCGWGDVCGRNCASDQLVRLLRVDASELRPRHLRPIRDGGNLRVGSGRRRLCERMRGVGKREDPMGGRGGGWVAGGGTNVIRV